MRTAFFVSISVLFMACDPPGPGGGCDPGGGSGACAEGLACLPDDSGANICQVPPGGECDLEAEEPYCAAGTECVEVTETVDGEEMTVGGCYLTRGSACDPIATTEAGDPTCDPKLQCAPFSDGTHKCELPIAFRGTITDSASGAGIEGAHILALDETPTAVTDVSISETDGAYRLDLPVLRNADGTPILGEDTFTLRASADGYLTFPGGIRTALPVNTNLAVMTADGWFIEGTIADIRLVAVENPDAPRITVSGHVVVDEDNQNAAEAGVLVVANPSASGGVGHSAISDLSGNYTIFNVTPGEYEVRGYRSSVQFTPQAISAVDAALEDVDLVANSNPLNTITGDIQIVGSGSNCNMTSIVLVVESTFDELVGRGEFPPGLRAPPLPQAPSIIPIAAPAVDWTIENVPDGRYVVLAAFENDGCVRDPDICQAGTETVHIELPTQNAMNVGTFKITDALPTVSPGAEAPQEVTERPTLTWGTDSNSQEYIVEVFDAYGDVVFTQMPVAETGVTMQSLAYTDPGPFDSGMFYQFRVTGRRETSPGNFCPNARTEDLRGVFFVP